MARVCDFVVIQGDTKRVIGDDMADNQTQLLKKFTTKRREAKGAPF